MPTIPSRLARSITGRTTHPATQQQPQPDDRFALFDDAAPSLFQPSRSSSADTDSRSFDSNLLDRSLRPYFLAPAGTPAALSKSTSRFAATSFGIRFQPLDSFKWYLSLFGTSRESDMPACVNGTVCWSGQQWCFRVRFQLPRLLQTQPAIEHLFLRAIAQRRLLCFKLGDPFHGLRNCLFCRLNDSGEDKDKYETNKQHEKDKVVSVGDIHLKHGDALHIDQIVGVNYSIFKQPQPP